MLGLAPYNQRLHSTRRYVKLRISMRMRKEDNLRLSTVRACLFGAAMSSGSIVILAHGVLHLGSIFTGLALFVPATLLIALSNWRDFKPNLCDGLFVAFASCVGLSLLLNGIGDPKEAILLAAALVFYPLGRLVIPAEARQGLLVLGSIVATSGCVATAIALVQQWSERHGKPMVFGQFDAAPAQFAMLLGLVLLAALTSDSIGSRWRTLIGALSVVAGAVFAASMVRFALVAIGLAALMGLLLDPAVSRRRIIMTFCALALTLSAGVAMRWNTSAVFLNHMLTATGAVAVSKDATLLAPTSTRCPPIDIDNSIAIRRQLLVDSFRLLPEAGPFGIGAGGFAQQSCLKGFEVHNSFLQTLIELGWLAGAILLLLLVCAWRSVFPMAKMFADYRFATCCLVFVTLLSVAHGHISRDFVLFAVIGFASALRSSRFATAEEWMLRDATTGHPIVRGTHAATTISAGSV